MGGATRCPFCCSVLSFVAAATSFKFYCRPSCDKSTTSAATRDDENVDADDDDALYDTVIGTARPTDPLIGGSCCLENV